MISSIFLAVAQNVVLGWLWRRVQELAAWTAGLLPLFMVLPAEHQALILGVLQGQGGGYTISAYIGFAVYLFSQWQSYRATVKPQVVTTDGKKVTIDKGSNTARQADAVASAAPEPKTLWDRLTGK